MSIDGRAPYGDNLEVALEQDGDRSGSKHSPLYAPSHWHTVARMATRNDYTDHSRDLSLDAHVVLQRRDQEFLKASFQIPPYQPQHSYPYVERQAAFQLPPSVPPYTQSAYFEVAPPGSHFPSAISGCQFRLARPRSYQATSLNPCSLNPHGLRPPFTQPSIYQRNTAQRQATPGTIRSDPPSHPPMSNVAPSMQCDLMGAFGGAGFGRYTNHGFSFDEIGKITPSAYDGTDAAWNVPSISNYASDAPCQMRPDFNAIPEGTRPTSPLFSQQPFSHSNSCAPPSPALRRPVERMHWTVSSRSARFSAEDRQRKAYHPQPPAKRSDWAMWVGNIPPNASHEELWKYFNATIPMTGKRDCEPWRGPSSIFLISRSSCAFVNFSSQYDLDRAVAFFNGKSLRPCDPRCHPMLCRVRRKGDDLRAGVGAQRGTGMHREWIKQQELQAAHPQPVIPSLPALPDRLGLLQTPRTTFGSVLPGPAVLDHPPDVHGRGSDSIVDEEFPDTDHRSPSNSYASTESSFLALHFPKRVFILKSIRTAELEESINTGVWRTQNHNEPILDQAFRTSSEVYLIFGANRSGQFFGYAKMVEPIRKQRTRSFSQSSKTTQGWESGCSSPHTPKYCSPQQHKHIEEQRPRAVSAPVSSPLLLCPTRSRRALSLPGKITPCEEMQASDHCQPHTDLFGFVLPPDGDPAEVRASTPDAKVVPDPYVCQGPSSLNLTGETETGKRQPLGSFKRLYDPALDAGLLKPSVVLGEENPRRYEDGEDGVRHGGLGQPFKVQWIRTGSLPFSRIRHLRNPWNADRPVQVSRDGTEVEPSVGALLMAEWEKM